MSAKNLPSSSLFLFNTILLLTINVNNAMISFYVNTLSYLVYLNIDFKFHCLVKREDYSEPKKSESLFKPCLLQRHYNNNQ